MKLNYWIKRFERLEEIRKEKSIPSDDIYSVSFLCGVMSVQMKGNHILAFVGVSDEVSGATPKGKIQRRYDAVLEGIRFVSFLVEET